VVGLVLCQKFTAPVENDVSREFWIVHPAQTRPATF
jgi:hypothetical protein